jgi:hypothetical protein
MITPAESATYLPPELRNRFRKAVLSGREIADRGVRAALASLGATPRDATPAATDLGIALQRRLASFGNDVDALVEECAYTQWHRVLFARFLAENDLLMYEPGVPLSLADCADLAAEREDGADLWDVAASYAGKMLPSIFRVRDPAAQLRLAAEHRHAMQEEVAELPSLVFTSADSLGWSYQYWQSHRKDELNDREAKIGGAELPAVTQLFTEPYMVDFLVDNTLGAWWASQRPDDELTSSFKYLRRAADGTPAADGFSGWPASVSDLRVMDPCCGSGHFLVAVFMVLLRMRMAMEGLSAADAGDAVLRENLCGLELDARCIQIAHFNLALHAWRTGGYRQLPPMRLACSSVHIRGQLDEWRHVAKGNQRLADTLERLHGLMLDSEHTGSLINPRREVEGELLTASLEETMPALMAAIGGENPTIFADAHGDQVLNAALAVELLAGEYHLVITNVPYLGAGKMAPELARFVERRYPSGKSDLATAMLARCSEMCGPGSAVAAVSPRHWLNLRTLADFRGEFLNRTFPALVAVLGARAFTSIGGEVVNVTLGVYRRGARASRMSLVDASSGSGPPNKAELLHTAAVVELPPPNTFSDWVLDTSATKEESVLLGHLATPYEGTSRGDSAQFDRCFWELPRVDPAQWTPIIDSPEDSSPTDVGRHLIYRWQRGEGALSRHPSYRPQGMRAWGVEAVVVSRTRLTATPSNGHHFAQNCVALVPRSNSNLGRVWAAVTNPAFRDQVRGLSQKLVVPTGVFEQVRVTDEPGAAPPPESESVDPRCWDFHGDPARARSPLHVACARLVGYRWPSQFDAEGSPVLDPLDPLADSDGVVCIPPTAGEPAAVERLRNVLQEAYGDELSTVRSSVFEDAGVAHADLEGWLRSKFFKQHCSLFHNRPFVWHIWDGRKDGFGALVNYHRLDRANLDRLIHTYLGDWIREQEAALERAEAGADLRVAAAIVLRDKLLGIARGEPPYDVYARWKRDRYRRLTTPPAWDPDLADGVRVNIRPFVTAGILRTKFTISWGADAGKETDGSPRRNDLHYPDYDG